MMRSDCARIFDIRRFSTHDGGGIRTTVFFKGCPLRCAWCHNPEGISPCPAPVWFEAKCMGCGSCVQLARRGGVRLENGRICLNPDADENWDEIMDECPTGALRWDCREISLDELMEEVRRDLPFYAHGGGGVTLSGGDPLLQYPFARKFLQRCRSEGIHTAVETEMYVPVDAAEQVLVYADLIYADLKIFDDELHRKYTGVSNELILIAFKWLLTDELRDRVVVRMPMIPQITATEENIAAVSRFISGLYSDVKLELLNYNPLAEAKYALVNREFCFSKNPPRYTAEEMAGFRRIAAQNGVKNIIEGE